MLAIGGNGRTAFYTAGADPAAPGTWADGLSFERDPGPYSPVGFMTAIDAPATLLPNGQVMCVAGDTYKAAEKTISYSSNPTTFFLYDPVGNSLARLAKQPRTNDTDTWRACLCLMPNGRVLYMNETNVIAMYSPDAAELTPKDGWRPTILRFPADLVVGRVHAVAGTQLNGLSQANGYGDDRQNATNFPLVRITDAAGRVRYLKTSSFSSMGVATGAAVVTADFQVPRDLPPGSYSLVVVANAIASMPVQVNVIARD